MPPRWAVPPVPSSPPTPKLDVPAWDPGTKELTYVASTDIPALRKAGILTGDDADLASSKEGLGGAITGFVAGAGHGATGGLANDYLLPAISRHIGHSAQRALGFSPEDLRDSNSFQTALEQAQALHPVANIAGNVTGFGGVGLLTGGLGDAAVLANAGIRGIETGVGIAAAGAATRVATASVLGGIEAARESARYNDPKMASAIMQGAVFGGMIGVAGEGAGAVLGKLATKAQRGTAKWLDDAALSGNFFGKKGYEKNFEQVYPGMSPDTRSMFEAQFDEAGFKPRDIENIRFARRIRPDDAHAINTPEQANEVLRQEQMLSAAVGIPKSKSRLGDSLTPLQSGEIPGLLTPQEIEKNLPIQSEAREQYLDANASAYELANEEAAARNARMAPFMEAHGREADEAAGQLDPTASKYNERLHSQRETFLADAQKTVAEKDKLAFLQKHADALSDDVLSQKLRYRAAGGEPVAAPADSFAPEGVAPPVPTDAAPLPGSTESFTTPGAPSHPQNIQMAELAAQQPDIPLPPQRILKRKWTAEQKADRAKRELENQFRISMHPVHENLHIEAGNALTDPAEIERAMAAGTHIRTPNGNVIPDYPEHLKLDRLEKATYRADDPAAPAGMADAGASGASPRAAGRKGARAAAPPPPEAPSLRGLSKDTLKRLRERPPTSAAPPIPPELEAMMQAHAAAGEPIHGLPNVPEWEGDLSPKYPTLEPFEAPAIKHIKEIIPGQRGYTKYTMRRPRVVTSAIEGHALGHIPKVGKALQAARYGYAAAQWVNRYATQFAFNHEAGVNFVLQRAVAPVMKGIAYAVRTSIDSSASRTSPRPIDELAVPTAHTDAAFDAVGKGVTRLATSPQAVEQVVQDKLGHITQGRKQLHDNLTHTLAQGVAFLQEAFPKPVGPAGALDAGHATVPRSVKRAYLDKYMGVTNPVACLQAPTKANISAVEAVHPDLLAYYREQVQAQLSDPKVAARVLANPEMRRRLSLVMGAPMSRSETPTILASMQQTASAATAGASAPPPGAPGMAKPPGNATVNITGNQARSFAGAGALPQQQDQLDNLGAS